MIIFLIPIAFAFLVWLLPPEVKPKHKLMITILCLILAGIIYSWASDNGNGYYDIPTPSPTPNFDPTPMPTPTQTPDPIPSPTPTPSPTPNPEPTTIPMFSVIQAFDYRGYSEDVPVVSWGETYVHGARFGHAVSGEDSFARFSLLGHEFTMLTATLLHIDREPGRQTHFYVYMDRERYTTFVVYENMEPMSIVLDISGVNLLEFRLRCAVAFLELTFQPVTVIGLGNVMIYPSM